MSQSVAIHALSQDPILFNIFEQIYEEEQDREAANKNLSAFSLVNYLWTSPARRLLLRHVNITSQSQREALLEFLDRQPGAGAIFRELSLSLKDLEPTAVCQLLQSFPNLRSLRLSDLPAGCTARAEDLGEVLSRFVALQDLDIHGDGVLDVETFLARLRPLRRLRNLSVAGLKLTTTSDTPELPVNGLTALKLCDATLDDQTLAALLQASGASLESLSLRRLEGPTLKGLKEAILFTGNKLQRLQVTPTPGQRGIVAEIFPVLAQLRYFHTGDASLPPYFFSHTVIPNLSELYLYSAADEPPPFSPAEIRDALRANPSIKSLGLSRPRWFFGAEIELRTECLKKGVATAYLTDAQFEKAF